MRPWWSTWPGALALFAVAVALVLPGVAAALVYVTLPEVDTAGLDVPVAPGPGPVARGAALVAAAVSLALPLLVVRWARRTWLGWLLVGIALCLVPMLWGLFAFGIL